MVRVSLQALRTIHLVSSICKFNKFNSQHSYVAYWFCFSSLVSLFSFCKIVH